MTLYCDTSSLVKRYVAEPGSDDVRARVADASVVVCASVGYVEMRATLARLRRERLVPPAGFEQIHRQFELDWRAMLAIDFTETVRQRAGQLAERHGLRALDGIHLASFQQLLERSTDDVYFSSFDERLTRAARKLR